MLVRSNTWRSRAGWTRVAHSLGLVRQLPRKDFLLPEMEFLSPFGIGTDHPDILTRICMALTLSYWNWEKVSSKLKRSIASGVIRWICKAWLGFWLLVWFVLQWKSCEYTWSCRSYCSKCLRLHTKGRHHWKTTSLKVVCYLHICYDSHIRTLCWHDIMSCTQMDLLLGCSSSTAMAWISSWQRTPYLSEQ